MSKLSLTDSWNWYAFQRALVGEEKTRVFEAIRTASVVNLRYLGKTQVELEKGFAFQLLELSLLAMLGMLACTEAAVRLDFDQRVKNRAKDPLSRRIPHRRSETQRQNSSG